MFAKLQHRRRSQNPPPSPPKKNTRIFLGKGSQSFLKSILYEKIDLEKKKASFRPKPPRKFFYFHFQCQRRWCFIVKKKKKKSWKIIVQNIRREKSLEKWTGGRGEGSERRGEKTGAEELISIKEGFSGNVFVSLWELGKFLLSNLIN